MSYSRNGGLNQLSSRAGEQLVCAPFSRSFVFFGGTMLRFKVLSFVLLYRKQFSENIATVQCILLYSYTWKILTLFHIPSSLQRMCICCLVHSDRNTCPQPHPRANTSSDIPLIVSYCRHAMTLIVLEWHSWGNWQLPQLRRRQPMVIVTSYWLEKPGSSMRIWKLRPVLFIKIK